ncbi:MFS hexose transporter [Purpureocillium lavendulum]|uniref:MFS hexose transporter n=1 Tax=Purpureocillium lavendulum TaxID=1247861 RepID=A0AB34FKD9_9HYPO|nr:MFS hexose transporter [Purpureocillium lavendulum]
MIEGAAADGAPEVDEDSSAAVATENILAAMSAGIKAYYRKHRPLIKNDETELINRLVGPERPMIDATWTQALEDEVQAEWDEKLKASIHGMRNEKRSRLLALWKTSLHLFRCSPVAIVSPAFRLWVTPANEDDLAWSTYFCQKLERLIAHPIWRGKKAQLRRAIQLACICRVNNTSSWQMERMEACGAIGSMVQLFATGGRNQPAKHFVDMAINSLDGTGFDPCTEATFLQHLASVCSPKTPPNATEDAQLQAKTKDLDKIVEALETFPGNYAMSTGSVKTIHDAYMAARRSSYQEATAPWKHATMLRLHEQAWKHEMRRAKRREHGMPYDDQSMAASGGAPGNIGSGSGQPSTYVDVRTQGEPPRNDDDDWMAHDATRPIVKETGQVAPSNDDDNDEIMGDDMLGSMGDMGQDAPPNDDDNDGHFQWGDDGILADTVEVGQDLAPDDDDDDDNDGGDGDGDSDDHDHDHDHDHDQLMGDGGLVDTVEAVENLTPSNDDSGGDDSDGHYRLADNDTMGVTVEVGQDLPPQGNDGDDDDDDDDYYWLVSGAILADSAEAGHDLPADMQVAQPRSSQSPPGKRRRLDTER